MNVTQKNIQTKLAKGLLDLIILQLLDNHPMHGYEVIVTIRKFYGVTFGASTIYPILNLMEKKNYIKCQWSMNSDRPRKVYELTRDGKCMLDYTTSSLKSICRTIGTDNIKANDEQLQFKVARSSKKKEYYTF